MRDRVLLVWDILTALRRRQRAACRYSLAAAAIAVLGTALIVGSKVVQPSPLVEPRYEPHSFPIVSPSAVRSQSPAAAVTRIDSTPSDRSEPRVLQGRALATAWLTGYLNRSSPVDARWVDAIRDLTTEELLARLRAEGPAVVGLQDLSSWRVRRILPISVVDQPIDTGSRQVLSFAATVTDGHIELEKPFQLYCYPDSDGRWRVAELEQPYSSEG